MIQRCSRLPAVMMLLAVMAFGTGMVFARRGHGNVALDAQLKQLQAEIAKPDARPDTWIKYGDALKSAGQYANAISAYEQVLKLDPFNQKARLGCGYCRAVLQDKDKFYRFMRETILVDPKLALAMFEQQPEVIKYLTDPRFQALKQDAFAGSMD